MCGAARGAGRGLSELSESPASAQHARSMAPQQRFSRKQVAERNSRADAVFIVDNVVYDVTPFLDEHPGGHEVLLNAAGRDASEDFADVGHSIDAKELMTKYAIGELVDEDRVEVRRRTIAWEEPPSAADAGFLSSWKFPLVLGLLFTALYSYLFA